jgi:hypothetical protein
MHYISEVMGHHSIDFTRKNYARFSPDSASRSVLRVLQGRKANMVVQKNENWLGTKLAHEGFYEENGNAAAC